MARVVGVRFRRSEKLQYFDPKELELARDEAVVAETEKGLELGWVAMPPREVVPTEGAAPLRPLLRKASPEDASRLRELRPREEQAVQVAKDKAKALSLPMKFVDGHYTLDGRRLTLYFGAEQRVDFRQLLRQLSDSLSVRVELRQIGARDEAKLTGGVGRCGRAICCVSWLTEFVPISVRMAKEQALPINAEGLAGQCGRLRCCLRFEYEQYMAVNKLLPRINEVVRTPAGEARVIVGHPVKETVSVILGDERVREFPLGQIVRISPLRKPGEAPRGEDAEEPAAALDENGSEGDIQ